MAAKINFRSIVFKRAYRIVRESKVSFSEALKQAWNRYRNYKQKVSEELASRMNGFDYYFSRSDDRRVYNKWSNEQRAIMQELESVPLSFRSKIQVLLKDPSDIKYFIRITF